MDDPIVNEVRKSREAILERYGGDLNKYFEHIRKEENKNPKKLAQISTKKKEKHNASITKV